ncbi:mucin-2-like [Macrobrachium nipponense]|uniref:mucin-2-like n=1 Tax=Macrobrachium nipponense TaxID=159736 RepID=UPI0030C81882
MQVLRVAAQLWLALGVFLASASSGTPMSPPDISGEEADIEDWRWRSREIVEMSRTSSPSAPSGADEEEASTHREGKTAESRSILTTLLSPFVGSRTRGSQKGSHKSREQGTPGRRPVQAYQQVRFVSSASPRFRPKGVRGRVPVPSQQPHVFQPISSSPVGISFPAIRDNANGQGAQNANSLTYRNSHFQNITKLNNGSKLNYIAKIREQSPASVISLHPFTFPPSTNSIYSPNHLRSSPQHISYSPSALIPNAHSSLLVNSGNQNRPFLAPAPSIRFSHNSQESPEIQPFENPPGNSGNSLFNNRPSEESPVNGFVSSQNANDITSNINIDNQFLKSFSSSQISFGPDNSFFLTGNLSEITGHEESTEKQRELQSFSAEHLTHQRPTNPTPTKITTLGNTNPVASQNIHAITTTEPTIIFITGAPTPYEIEHLTGLSTIPTGISPIPFQQEISPHFALQTFQAPLSHSQATPIPKASHQEQTTPLIQYQTLTTSEPLRELLNTLAPIQKQLLSLAPKHRYQTTSPKQYHTKAQVTPYWKLLTTQPQHRTQPTVSTTQVQIGQDSLVEDRQQGTASIQSGSKDDNSLTSLNQNQLNSNVNVIHGSSQDNTEGFIPFNDSNEFFSHIFGDTNPFGTKIITEVPSNITSISGPSPRTDFNSAHQQNQQQPLTRPVPFVNRPTQHATVPSTASPANEPTTQTFTPEIVYTSQPLIQQSFFTNQSPTTSWPSAPFSSPTNQTPINSWPSAHFSSPTNQSPTTSWPSVPFSSPTDQTPTNSWPSAPSSSPTNQSPTNSWPSAPLGSPTNQTPTNGWPSPPFSSPTNETPTNSWPSAPFNSPTTQSPTSSWPSAPSSSPTIQSPTSSWPSAPSSSPTIQSPISSWPSAPAPFRGSASVFVSSDEKDPESGTSQSPLIFSGGWSHLEGEHSTTEAQIHANLQSGALNTDTPLRAAEPFTVAEGGENPYTTLNPVQTFQDPGSPHVASQTNAPFQEEDDTPPTITATTTIDDKEFEVLVLPYEKEEADGGVKDTQDITQESSSIALAPASAHRASFNPGIPLKPTEEEVSVYLVRHRKPATVSGGSPTPPTSPTPPPPASPTLSPTQPNVTAFFNDSAHFGLDALEFRGFPIPVDLTPKNDGPLTLLSSPSRVTGTAISASGRHFKFEYDDVEENGTGNFLPNSFKGLDSTNENTNGEEEEEEEEKEEDINTPYDEPHEYIQVLGLLAPPPGVVCDHGICFEDKGGEFQRK